MLWLNKLICLNGKFKSGWEIGKCTVGLAFSCSGLIKMYKNIIIFREAYKAGEVLWDWVAVLILLRPDPVRALVPLGQVLDLEHSRMLVIPGFTHFPTIVPKALIVTSVATSHVTLDHWGPLAWKCHQKSETLTPASKCHHVAGGCVDGNHGNVLDLTKTKGQRML